MDAKKGNHIVTSEKEMSKSYRALLFVEKKAITIMDTRLYGFAAENSQVIIYADQMEKEIWDELNENGWYIVRVTSLDVLKDLRIIDWELAPEPTDDAFS